MTSINHILLAVLVIIIIFWLFENMNSKYNEGFNNYQDFSSYREKFRDPYLPEVQEFTIPTKPSCPINSVDVKTKYYLDRYLLGSADVCPKPTKSIKQFNKDFFNFRDTYTNENSSIRLDPVDKVVNMYLAGDLGEAKGNNKAIKDVFDDLTRSGPSLYNNECVRLPKFDNTMNDGYNFKHLTGMHNVRDDWEYKGDREMNSGILDKTLRSNDPSAINQMASFNQILGPLPDNN